MGQTLQPIGVGSDQQVSFSFTNDNHSLNLFKYIFKNRKSIRRIRLLSRTITFYHLKWK